MTHPLIIQCGNRKAVINGQCIALLKKQNKKRDCGVWPEKAIIDGVARMNAAFLWTMKGIIDFGDNA